MADARTQVVHNDSFTFAENAPDDLAGKTFTKKEAASLLKERGLALSGKSAKKKTTTNRRVITEQEIMDKWAQKEANADKVETPAVAQETPVEVPKPLVAPSPVSDKKSLSLIRRANVSQIQGVDSDILSQDTIAETWPGLKKQARELGISVPRTMKRPELEQLVRDQIVT